MHIRNGKDFWAGLMFVGAGLSFMLVAQNYPMGSAVRMGPAYFPTMLGGLLALLGAVVFVRGFVSKIEHPLKVFTFRLHLLIPALVIGVATYFAGGGEFNLLGKVFSAGNLLKDAPMVQFALGGLALFLFIAAFGPRAMFVILIAVVLFGYALKPLGLVISVVLLVVLSALGGHDFRKQEIAILAIVLALFSVFVFVKGLGLPFNLWPGQ